MKNNRYLAFLAAGCALGAALVACSFTPATPAIQPTLAEPEPSPTVQPASPTTALPLPPTALPPTATETSLPASPTPVPFPVEFPQPGTVVLDFVALACRAHWANGARDLPCPGNRDDLAEASSPPQIRP